MPRTRRNRGNANKNRNNANKNEWQFIHFKGRKNNRTQSSPMDHFYRVAGFKNLGSSCSHNSCFQLYFHHTPFVNWITCQNLAAYLSKIPALLIAQERDRQARRTAAVDHENQHIDIDEPEGKDEGDTTEDEENETIQPSNVDTMYNLKDTMNALITLQVMVNEYGHYHYIDPSPIFEYTKAYTDPYQYQGLCLCL